MRYNGIVFDMDGLMFDTERLAIEGWLHAAKVHGQPITRQHIIGTIGFNTRRTQQYYEEHFGTDFDYALMSQTAREHIHDLIRRDGLPKKPGLVTLLDYLKEKSYPIALATSTRYERACENLERAGVIGYFSAIVGGDMVSRSKPEPDIYIEACRRLGLDPRGCLALEDSPAGIRSATSAGLSAIMIPDIIPPGPETQALLTAELSQLTDVIDHLEQT